MLFEFADWSAGDVNSIVVGSKSSIGDNCVVHVSGTSNGAFGEAAATKIGDKVVVESGSILHGCELHDGCKVCAGSVVFDGAVIESGGVLSAGSMLTAGKKVPSGQLWAGRPAEFVRELTAEEKAELELEAEKMYSSAKKHEAEHTLSPQERYARADVRAETELRPNPNY
jgi:carbonic anhydrase/acetyltransferase-like protein (isoleucine patch superfamily)